MTIRNFDQRTHAILILRTRPSIDFTVTAMPGS